MVVAEATGHGVGDPDVGGRVTVIVEEEKVVDPATGHGDVIVDALVQAHVVARVADVGAGVGPLIVVGVHIAGSSNDDGVLQRSADGNVSIQEQAQVQVLAHITWQTRRVEHQLAAGSDDLCPKDLPPLLWIPTQERRGEGQRLGQPDRASGRAPIIAPTDGIVELLTRRGIVGVGPLVHADLYLVVPHVHRAGTTIVVVGVGIAGYRARDEGTVAGDDGGAGGHGAGDVECDHERAIVAGSQVTQFPGDDAIGANGRRDAAGIAGVGGGHGQGVHDDRIGGSGGGVHVVAEVDTIDRDATGAGVVARVPL